MQKQEKRLVGEGILIAVGLRLYTLLCPNCKKAKMCEDVSFSHIKCESCGNILAIKADEEVKNYIFGKSSGEHQILQRVMKLKYEEFYREKIEFGVKS